MLTHRMFSLMPSLVSIFTIKNDFFFTALYYKPVDIYYLVIAGPNTGIKTLEKTPRGVWENINLPHGWHI